jgi:hypothetical protein
MLAKRQNKPIRGIVMVSMAGGPTTGDFEGDASSGGTKPPQASYPASSAVVQDTAEAIAIFWRSKAKEDRRMSDGDKIARRRLHRAACDRSPARRLTRVFGKTISGENRHEINERNASFSPRRTKVGRRRLGSLNEAASPRA